MLCLSIYSLFKKQFLENISSYMLLPIYYFGLRSALICKIIHVSSILSKSLLKIVVEN